MDAYTECMRTYLGLWQDGLVDGSLCSELSVKSPWHDSVPWCSAALLLNHTLLPAGIAARSHAAQAFSVRCSLPACMVERACSPSRPLARIHAESHKAPAHCTPSSSFPALSVAVAIIQARESLRESLHLPAKSLFPLLVQLVRALAPSG